MPGIMIDPLYLVASIRGPKPQQNHVEAFLYDFGCLGLEEASEVEESFSVKAYFAFPEEDQEEVWRQKLRDLLPASVQVDTCVISLRAPSFEAYGYSPIPLIDDIWIVPPKELSIEPNPIGCLLYIRPGLAFGTGRHETTRLCAQLMKDLRAIEADPVFLDIGTGSGVLTLLAHQWGWKKLHAVEICPDATKNAQGNFDINHVKATMSAKLEDVAGTFNVIVANMVTPTLIHLAPMILEKLAPQGSLILSGVTTWEKEAIEKAYQECELLQCIHEGDWLGLLFKKK